MTRSEISRTSPLPIHVQQKVEKARKNTGNLDEIEYLLRYRNKHINAAIAANPHIPLSILYKIPESQTVAAAIWQNPALPLWLIEDTHALLHFSAAMTVCLLRTTEDSNYLLQVTRSKHGLFHPEIQKVLVQHPHTPAAAVVLFATCRSADIRALARIHRHMPTQERIWLEQLSGDKTLYTVTPQNVDDCQLDDTAWIWFLEQWEWALFLVAQHPKAPVHILQRLANSTYVRRYPYVLHYLRKNPAMPVDEFPQLP